MLFALISQKFIITIESVNIIHTRKEFEPNRDPYVTTTLTAILYTYTNAFSKVCLFCFVLFFFGVQIGTLETLIGSYSDHVLLLLRSLFLVEQDWRSPVYSGRFEYICWYSLYSPHFCIHFSSLSYSWAPNPVHWCTIGGYWNFRLESVMRYTSQQTASMIAISSLDFLLLSCLNVRLRNALLNITKYMSSTGTIRNFGRLRAILWNVFNPLSRLNLSRERNSSLVPIKWPYHLQAETIVPAI